MFRGRILSTFVYFPRTSPGRALQEDRAHGASQPLRLPQSGAQEGRRGGGATSSRSVHNLGVSRR